MKFTDDLLDDLAVTLGLDEETAEAWWEEFI